LERSLATKPDVHDPEAKAIYDKLLTIEESVVEYLASECSRSPIWPWLSGVKGIGPRLGGMLVGLIDIERAPTVSSLWRYAGLAVIDGKAERREKGKKLPYNDLLKKTCFLIGRSFLMGKHPLYEPLYREARIFYERERPDWTDGRRHNAARRKMVKMFLSHLWTKWREAVNLPVRPPYAQQLPGHAGGYLPPPEPEPRP